MKSKKAIILGDFVIGIIVAVLCIAILIYLSVHLAGIYTTKNEPEKAESHMNKLGVLIQTMQEGDSKTYFLNSPNDWALAGFPSAGYRNYGDASPYDSYEAIPLQCTSKDWKRCVCLCFDDNLNSLDNSCNEYKTNNLCISLDRFEGFSVEGGNIKVNDLVKSGKFLKLMIEDNKLKVTAV
jgi:hypothetical protein